MRCFAAAVGFAGLSPTASCLQSNPTSPLYIRNDWGSERGFPGGPVHAISQTEDGYLWIGTEKGLIRFDGLDFRTFDGTNSQGLLSRAVQGLTTDADGNLWLQQQDTTLLRYRGKKFQDILRGLVRRSDGVTSMCRGRDGEILFPAYSLGILAYGRGGLRTVTVQANLPGFLIISMTETPDGQVWFGTRDAGLFSVLGGRVTSFARGLPDRKVNSLLAVETRDLWIGTDNGAVRWNGVGLTTDGIPTALEHIKILAMIKDRRSNIWVSTASGLLRIDSKGPPVWEQRWRTPGDAVTALFEDREGNVWVGTKEGLERFRESPFLAYALPAGSESENDGPLYVDDEGRTWSATPDGGLVWRRGAELQRITEAGLSKDVVYSIAGRNSDVWIGRRRGGLTHLHYRGGALVDETYTQEQGLPQNSIYAVNVSWDGSVWAGTLTGGVSRFHNGRFTTYTVANGLISNTITAIAESPDGTMWFGTPDGLSEYSPKGWKNFSGRDKLPSGGVNCAFVDSENVSWIGTGAGLASIRDGQIHVYLDSALVDGILGITEDRSGWLWVATTKHILRVKRLKLLQGALDSGDLSIFGLTDGLLGEEGVKRQQSAVRDSQGRIWFSTNRGICVVNPDRLISDSHHVLAHIQSISADGSPLPIDDAVAIPPGRTRIIFSYVGLSLSSPERVRYRYKLDGFDKDWTDSGSNQQALYMNLSPGSYSFRVAATDAAGIWSGTEATTAMRVEPAFWQTWWFYLFLASFSTGILWLLYRLRIRSITARILDRLEQRESERLRIARDLHDTLLQSLHGLMLRFHFAAEALGPSHPNRPMLQLALDRADALILEGRNRVEDLRGEPAERQTLAERLAEMVQELRRGSAMQIRLSEEGTRRSLQPNVQNEMFSITRECLSNAVVHSDATEIDLVLSYGRRTLRAECKDNGVGMQASVARSGKKGHWGLIGMKERARSFGATLEIRSTPGHGTRIEIAVRASIAYVRPPSLADRVKRSFRKRVFIEFT